jgi:hypothetical protein
MCLYKYCCHVRIFLSLVDWEGPPGTMTQTCGTYSESKSDMQSIEHADSGNCMHKYVRLVVQVCVWVCMCECVSVRTHTRVGLPGRPFLTVL